MLPASLLKEASAARLLFTAPLSPAAVAMAAAKTLAPL